MKFRKILASVMLLAAAVTLASCGEKTVKFETNGGSTIESVVTTGVLAKPTDPTKEGYTFKGWFSDSECKKEFDFTQKISADISIYAKWEIKTYTVKFDIKDYAGIAEANRPANPASVTVEHGKEIAAIAFVAPTGYSIAWFTDAACTTTFAQTTVMKADTTIYGKLTKNTYELIFDLDGGTLYLIEGSSKTEVPSGRLSFTYGQSISEVIANKYLPEKVGFEASYFTDAEHTTEIDEAFLLSVNAKNVTIYVKWTKVAIPAPTGEKKEYTFVEADAAGDTTTNKVYGDFEVTAKDTKTVKITENGKTNEGLDPFTHRLQLGGAGGIDFRSIKFTTTGRARLTVYCLSSSSSAGNERTAVLLTEQKNTIADPYLSSATGEILGNVNETKSTYVLEMEIDAAGTYYFLSADGGLNVYKIQYQLY